MRVRQVATRSRRPHARHEDGLTLVETLIAVFILAVAILALASVAAASILGVRVARDRGHATAAASAVLEQVRSFGFLNAAHSSADGSLDASAASGDDYLETDGTDLYFDHDGAGPDPREQLVIRDEGDVDDWKCEPAETCWDVEREGEITVRTFVTDYPDAATGEPAVRVTAVATWTDRGDPREVRESTVISRANRGLPVPNFDIDGEIALEVSDLEAPGTDEYCFTHTFRNLGARDSYHFTVADMSTTAASDALRVTRTVDDGSSVLWTVKVWLGDGATDDPPATNARMVTDPSTSAPDLVTQQPVENMAEEELQVCFSSNDIDPGDTFDQTFGTVFASTFDPSVQRTVSYRLIADDFELDLFLHDTNPTTDHARGSCDALNEMNTNAPTWGTSGGEKAHNYDTDLDPDGHEGIYLGIAADCDDDQGADGGEDYVGVWDHQFLDSTTLGGTATLTIWSGHDDSLRTGSGRTSKTLKYRVILERVTSGDDATVTHLGEDTMTYVHDTSPDFQEISIPVDFDAGAVDFGSGEFLRVRVLCEDAAPAAGEPPADDCHVMYDHADFSSKLLVSSP